MPKTVELQNVAQLLIDAEKLIQQINSDATKDMQEERIRQFEKDVQNLKNETTVKDMIVEKGTSGIISSAEGIHEAIQDIVKAMSGLKGLGVHSET